MKYQKQLDKLCSGAMSRADITKLKANAEALVAMGDKDALIILDNINSSPASCSAYKQLFVAQECTQQNIQP